MNRDRPRVSRVFVDTSAWYALAAADDRSHERAVRLLSEHQGRLATTEGYVCASIHIAGTVAQ